LHLDLPQATFLPFTWEGNGISLKYDKLGKGESKAECGGTEFYDFEPSQVPSFSGNEVLRLFYVRPFWATVCKTVRPMLSDRCPVCL